MENLPALNLKNLDKSHWKTYRFDEIAKNISERVDPNNTDLEVYVGLEHIDSESIHLKRSGTPDDVDGQKLRFYPGDVIFGRRRAYQRKAAVANTHGFCSAHALVLRANPEVIDPQLFPFFMHSDAFMHRAVDISVGSLSPTINWGTLKSEKFYIPPTKVQSLYFDLLSTIDFYYEKKSVTLEQLKQLVQVKIEKQLLGNGSEKIFLKNLGEVIRGVGFKPSDLITEYSEHSCVILRSNNISNSKINYEDIIFLPASKVKESQFLKNGDFAICMSNGSKELVGKAAILKDCNFNISIGSFCAGFRAKNEFNQNLLEHLFSSYTYRNFIKTILSGTSINNLKPSDIENLYFHINLKNIDELLAELKLLNMCIERNQSELENLILLKRKLINKIF